MNQTLLILVCPPSIERTVVDCLLEQPDIADFTSSEVYGHGSDPQKLNLIEQVEGRKKQIKFQVYTELEYAHATIQRLKEDLKGTDINYWLVPIIETGCL
jgi:hypothetical protein